MRFGYWLPVFGGWLRNVDDEGMAAEWSYVRRLARASERAGFDLTLIAELNRNDIKGAEAPALDAWSTAAALAAGTDRLELMGAVRPTFHPPALLAKQAANIDHNSGGRLSLHAVSSWWGGEAEQYGGGVETPHARHASAAGYQRAPSARVRRRRLCRVSCDRNGGAPRGRADYRCPAECRRLCELRAVAGEHPARATREPGGLFRLKSRAEGGAHGNAGTDRRSHSRVRASGRGSVATAVQPSAGRDGTLCRGSDAARQRAIARAIRRAASYPERTHAETPAPS